MHLVWSYGTILAKTAVGSSFERQSTGNTVGMAEELVRQGIFTTEVLEFLRVCILARLNLAIAGPPRSGKRMLLHTLVDLISSDGQILAIQNPDEPSLECKGITTLRANLHPDQGKHRIPRDYLLTLAPKMHPQGLLLDGVDGSEAVALLKLLLAMDGVWFSIIAESPEDALDRLEDWVLVHGAELGADMIRRILSTSLHLVIQLGKARDGVPTIVSLTEVGEIERDAPALRDIFVRQNLGLKETASRGVLRPTGIKPHFLDRMEMLGISIPEGIFIQPHSKNGAAS